MSSNKYKRILLKLSGEALAGKSGFGIDVAEAETIAGRVKEVHEMGVEVAVVIGAAFGAVVTAFVPTKTPGPSSWSCLSTSRKRGPNRTRASGKFAADDGILCTRR